MLFHSSVHFIQVKKWPPADIFDWQSSQPCGKQKKYHFRTRGMGGGLNHLSLLLEFTNNRNTLMESGQLIICEKNNTYYMVHLAFCEKASL